MFLGLDAKNKIWLDRTEVTISNPFLIKKNSSTEFVDEELLRL